MSRTRRRNAEARILEEAFTLHQNACALRDAGDVPGATVALANLAARCPTYYPGWCSLARFRITARNFAGALDAAREAIRCAPEQTAGHINAGIALRELGQLEGSRQHLENAVRCDAEAPLAHYQLARTLQRLEQHRDAAAAYALAIAHATRAMDHGQSPGEIITESIESAAALPEIPDATPFLNAFIAAVRALSYEPRARAHAAVEHLTAVAATVEERDISARLTERYWQPKA